MSDQLPKFKFLLNDGLSSDFLPCRGSERASGWDVRAASNYTIKPSEYAKIDLGFKMFSPEGWWMELRPRSSSFVKKQLHALYGVIDEDYEGQCIFAAQYNPAESERSRNSISGNLPDIIINAGDAIGQIIPVRRQDMLVEQVSKEEFDLLCKQRNAKRGAGGFGSTDGKK